ncbi:MAG: hypothetical protein ACTSU5_03120 [Promethearchaeota archaeon]
MVEVSPDFVWNILEMALIPVMVGVGVFFLVKGLKERKAGNPSTATFNIGYFLFFLVNSVNQLSYVADSIHGWWPAFKDLLDVDATFSVGGLSIKLNSQIVFMIACFTWSFLPNMYTVEKYIRNSKRFPVTLMNLVACVLSTAMWVATYAFGVTWEGGVVDVFVFASVVYVFLVGVLIILLFLAVYLDLARKTPGEVRTKSLIIAFGIIFMYVSLIGGNLLRGEGILTGWLQLVGPILLLSGMAVLVYGFSKKI